MRARRWVVQHHASRRPAQANTLRGLLWIAFIGYEFFLLSNPVALLETFDEAWWQARVLAVVMLVLQLPWLRLPRVPAALLAFTAICMLSAWWSISPTTTWETVLLYSLLAFLGLMVAANATGRVLVWGFLLGGVIIMATSWYVFVEQVPRALIIPGMNGYLAGVGTNKNILSYCMVLSFAFAVAYLPRHWGLRALWGLGVAVLLLGVFLSVSVTGYAGILILACQGVLLAVLERWSRTVRRWVMLGLSAAMAAVVAVLVLVPNAFSAATGRDNTLSGRVPLWQATFEQSRDHLAIGAGWGAVWRHPWLEAPDNDLVEKIYAGAGTLMYHGHNSFLDILPQLGILGVLALLWLHVLPLRRGMQLRAHPDAGRSELLAGRLMITVPTALLLCGVTEPSTSIPLGWFLLAVVLEIAARRRPSQGRRARSAD